MERVEAIHRALDELAIALGERNATLHMLSLNRELMAAYRGLFQLQLAKPALPNGKPKEPVKQA